MSKKDLLTNLVAPLKNDGEPFVSVRYSEFVRGTFKRRYFGKLEINIADPETGYVRDFSKEFDITDHKRGRSDEYSRNNLDYLVSRYLNQEVDDALRIGQDADSTISRFQDIKEKVYRQVATATEQNSVFNLYQERLEEELQAEEKRKATVIKKKQAEQEQRIRRTISSFEYAAMDLIAINSSKPLEYVLSDETLRERVDSLFDPDNNLLHRPMFNPGKNGEWAEFVRRVLGQGLYNKLEKVENDLDRFYAKISQRTRMIAGEGIIPTKESYEQAIRESSTLEETLDLLDREHDVNLDVLQRFKEKLAIPPVNYTKAATRMMDYLSFQGGLFTTTSEKTSRFIFNYNIDDDHKTFSEFLGSLTNELRDYLEIFEDELILPSNKKPGPMFNKKDNPLVIKVAYNKGDKSFLLGSSGILKTKSNDSYGYGFGYRYDHVQFGFATGEKSSEKNQSFPLDNFRLAEKLRDRYKNLDEATRDIVSRVSQAAINDVEDKQLVKDQGKIREFHPYLDHQMTFVSSFQQGMKARFENLFSQKVLKEQEPSGKDEE